MAWQYRAGLLLPFAIQLCLLGLGILGLNLVGLGLDTVFHAVAPTKKAAPHFPLGIQVPETWSTMQIVTAICLAIIGFSIIRGLLNLVYTVAIARLIQGRLVVDLRAAVYDKLQRLSFKFYDSHETGSLINRVTGDVQSMGNFINGVALQLLVLILSLAFYLGYMLRISPKLTLACLATTPLLWYGSYSFSNLMKTVYRKNRELFDKLILVLSENLQGIHVVKGFNIHGQQIERFHAANLEYKHQQRRMFWLTSLFTPAISYVTQINLAVLLGYGGWMVLHGELAFGTGLWVFGGLLNIVSGQVQGLAGMSNQIQMALVSARRVFDVLDAKMEIQSPANARRLPRAKGKLEFRNVTFEFEPGKPVLREVSFVVEPGQCMAILGPTGAGKTALLSLISRFYDPTAGQILVDDVDIRQYDLYDLRRAMGLVFQETFLFSNSIRSNIAFGHPDATAEQVITAAKIANAHEFVSAMKEGYESVLAEGGSNLSGGQRQRLAIARAILLQPSFLLLDDPMAAVDAQTEHEMSEALTAAMAGRTTLLVANRISSLRRADLILVMQKGRIAQRGTHDQLMNIPGHYRETARLQIDEDARKAMATTGGAA